MSTAFHPFATEARWTGFEFVATADVPVHLKRSLTPEQVEALTGVSARTVRALANKGVLRRVPHTSRILIPRTALDAWLGDVA